MDKAKEKIRKKYNQYNGELLKSIAEQFKVTEQYVRQCLRGERNSYNSDRIRLMYKSLHREINNVINNQKNKES